MGIPAIIWRSIAIAVLLAAIFFGASPRVGAQLSCGQKMFTSAGYIGCIGAGTGGGGGGGGSCTGALDLSTGCAQPMAIGVLF